MKSRSLHGIAGRVRRLGSEDCLKSRDGKIAIISNAKIFGLYGERVRKSLENAGFEVSVFLMKDGERHKNLRSLENVAEIFRSK